jgi:hypothetical protein
MSQTSDPTQFASGIGIQNNKEFLKNIPEFAMAQLRDQKRGVANARANAVRTNSALPERSWQIVDDTVYRTQDDTLKLVSDLRQAGLVTEVDLMAKNDTWPVVDDQGEASVGTTPETADAEGSLSWGDDGVPVPVIYDSFSLGFREGPAESNNPGEGMDTLGVTTTSRRVNERIEKLFVDGWDATINFEGDGYTLYGLTNHPQANTLNADADWSNDDTVIRSDIRRLRSVIKNDNNFAPGGVGYWLYLGTEWYDTLDNADPQGSGDMTIRERVENLSNISKVEELDFLDEKSALMFRPTEDVVDVGVAAQVQPVMWENPFRDNWTVLGSVYPRVKRTKSNQSGVAYMTA